MSKVIERPDSAARRHDTLSEHQEVIRAIEPAVADHLRLLLALDRAWQPTDHLPDFETANWRDEVERAISRHVAAIRKHCEPGDLECRRRQRQAVLHWAYDSRRI